MSLEINLVNPKVLIGYYNITNTTASESVTQQIVTLKTGNVPNKVSAGDLASFLEYLNITSDTISKFIGGNYFTGNCDRSTASCEEPNLDVQYLMGISRGAYTIHNSQSDVFRWIIAEASLSHPAMVSSISYGYTENALINGYTSYLDSFNTEAMKLALMGVTILAASGDDGVANFPAHGDISQCSYNPSFPASNPYVLAVGGTQGPETSSDEIAANCSTAGITTGGGFSNYYPAPSYQQGIISDYFSSVGESLKIRYNLIVLVCCLIVVTCNLMIR
jgi:subtilase family serine protease